MIYYLPTIESNQEGYECLAALAKDTKALKASRLELDLSRVTFLEANMSAPLGAVLARIADRFNAIEIVNVPVLVERILRKNGFLTNYRYQPIEDERSSTIPYRRLQRTDEGVFEDYLQQHLKGKGIPRMSEGMGKVFKKKIFEVFQNAVIHSESALGIFACGQFFRQEQRLDLTIADAGVGIRTNVRKVLGPKVNSVHAIQWAMKEGNTSKTGAQPGGLGLKLLHDFVSLNKGKIQIASRFGFYQFESGTESFTKMSGDYPGTVVTIEVNTADTCAYRLASEVSQENIF